MGYHCADDLNALNVVFQFSSRIRFHVVEVAVGKPRVSPLLGKM